MTYNPGGLRSACMPLDGILQCAEDAHSLPCAHMIGMLSMSTVNSAGYSDAAGIRYFEHNIIICQRHVMIPQSKVSSVHHSRVLPALMYVKRL